jgi:hypothetical protein
MKKNLLQILCILSAFSVLRDSNAQTWNDQNKTLKEVDSYIPQIPPLGVNIEFKKYVVWKEGMSSDDIKKLNVPTVSIKPTGDSSSVVAVANALNFLFTKAEGHPVQISESFLLWANDMYNSQGVVSQFPWSSNNAKMSVPEEGGVEIQHVTNSQKVIAVTPPTSKNTFDIPVYNPNEHESSVGRVLSALLKFGICEQSQMPDASKPPTQEVITNALSHIDPTKNFTIKCFQGWEDPVADWDSPLCAYYTPSGEIHKSKLDLQYDRSSTEAYDRLNKKAVELYSFINTELSLGRIIIITYIINGRKVSFDILGCRNKPYHFNMDTNPMNGFTFLGDDGDIINTDEKFDVRSHFTTDIDDDIINTLKYFYLQVRSYGTPGRTYWKRNNLIHQSEGTMSALEVWMEPKDRPSVKVIRKFEVYSIGIE